MNVENSVDRSNDVLNSTFLLEWRGLMTGYWLTDLANASAHVFTNTPRLNWAGFYLMVDGKLKLGPFQGLAACVEIPLNKGVCGAAATLKRSQRVADVHAFPGHIACDERSRSELVIPFGKGSVWGVLDLDSPVVGRFTEQDEKLMELFCATLIEKWPSAPWL